MRLVIAADSPEHLWLPLITVQAVLRDNSRTRACLLSVTKPASMSACRSSRSLADCLAFMLELIDAGLRLGPFCGPARVLVLSIVPPPPKTGSGKVRPRYVWFCDAQHKIYIFLPHSHKHELAREI